MSSPSHSHGYLLSGIKGIGKTSIGRIIGDFFQAEIIEIDAASHSQVDRIRDIVEQGRHRSMLADTGVKMFLIDECHRLSGNAFDALLKVLEEPPPHLYFVLCTTEVKKVPDTIVSRCYPVPLVALSPKDLHSLFMFISEQEGWAVNRDVMSAVVVAADGSARQGLTILQAVHDCKNTDEVKRITKLIEEGDPEIQIIAFILRGGREYGRIKDMLSKIDDNFFRDDSGIIHIGRYLCGAIARAETESVAKRAWILLHLLTETGYSYDNKAVFYRAIGACMWGMGVAV